MLKYEIMVFQKWRKVIKMNAYLTGISDFFFVNSKKDRRNIPPLWMDKEEKQQWKKGNDYAKSQIWVK